MGEDNADASISCAASTRRDSTTDPASSSSFFVLLWSTALLSFFLPRPLFCKLFKIAFPFMPDRLEDLDEKDWETEGSDGW
jgi:hypothetical protein